MGDGCCGGNAPEKEENKDGCCSSNQDAKNSEKEEKGGGCGCGH